MNVELKENEEIEDLELNNWKIIQNKKEFCFGMDSVLLADFAKHIKQGSTVVDLGTGTGILGILLCGKSKLKKVIGVEVQENVADMARRSVDLNNLQDKFEVINEDVNNLDSVFKIQSVDIVITNPPYKKLNSGGINKNEAKLISRHEVKCMLDDVIRQSNYLLKNNGELYMVHRPERLVDICFYLRKYKLEPKNIRFVHSRKDSSPKLVLIKCVKASKPFLKVDKPLVIYDDENNYTDEILRIYGK